MNKDTAKLFRVLVLGGLSMAIPACSGDTTGDDAGGAVDSGKDQSSQGNEAGNDAAQDSGGQCVQIHCPDCGSGVCGW